MVLVPRWVSVRYACVHVVISICLLWTDVPVVAIYDIVNWIRVKHTQITLCSLVPRQYVFSRVDFAGRDSLYCTEITSKGAALLLLQEANSARVSYSANTN